MQRSRAKTCFTLTSLQLSWFAIVTFCITHVTVCIPLESFWALRCVSLGPTVEYSGELDIRQIRLYYVMSCIILCNPWICSVLLSLLASTYSYAADTMPACSMCCSDSLTQTVYSKTLCNIVIIKIIETLLCCLCTAEVPNSIWKHLCTEQIREFWRADCKHVCKAECISA